MTETNVHRILLVDDEPAVLEGLCRQHRKHFTLSSADGPEAGLQAIAHAGPFAVVVSDYKMPGMNGAEFLARCQEAAPDTVRMMLTGQADLTTAIDAVNRGNIFRFLTKPCDRELFRAVLQAGLHQFELVQSERILLEHTVKGSIEVLADVLEVSNPAAFGRATRARHHVRHIASSLGLADPWKFETAALLSQVGCVAVPNDLFDRVARGERLDPTQSAVMEKHPQLAHDLLAKIPRLRSIAQMVRYQQAEPVPPKELDVEVRLGSRILAAALDYEELVSWGATPEQARAKLRTDASKYGTRILDALSGADSQGGNTDVAILRLAQLHPGMVLEEEVRSESNDMLIAPRGHRLTISSLERLRNYAELGHLAKTELRVRRPRSADADPASAA